jgi:hypothetical protein
MTPFEAYWRTPKTKGIDAVVAANPSQTVIVNGNFVGAIDTSEFMSTRCHGKLIINGSVHSQASDLPGSVFSTAQAFYVGQYPSPNATFEFGRGLVLVSKGFRGAMGGLNREYKQMDTKAQTMLGYALVDYYNDNLVSKKALIFTASTDVSIDPNGDGTGVAGFVTDAKEGSGASEVLGLDGSSSVALAYASPNGTLSTKFKGAKHVPNNLIYWVNTYFMFECTKPR